MPKPYVFPRYIRAPSPAPESFPGDRVQLYKWLAPRLLGTDEYELDWPQITCITAERMLHPRLDEITQLLQFENIPDNQSALDIIDIANNQYHSLNDIFLYQVAKAIRGRLKTAEHRKIAILLPLLPADGSVFWHSMPSVHGRSIDTVSTFVLANDGRSWPSGYLSPRDQSAYRSIAAGQTPNLLEMLRARTVTQIGHYDLGRTDRPSCATYFFDTEAAENEIGELTIRWARENGITGARFTLISYGRHNAATRFHRAISGAATELGCGFHPIKASDPMPSSSDINGLAVLVLNVVDKGLAFRRVVNSLRAQGVSMAPKALTVLLTCPGARFGRRYPELGFLCDSFERKIVPRRECPQCRLGLTHTPRVSDRYLPIRAIDIWQILLNCKWNQETFGPLGRHFLRYAPDMAEVFDRHGDWFAYKIGELLRSVGMDRDIVFVSPEEPHVERLIRRLGIIMQNRQVAVMVPRAVLNSPDLDHYLEQHSGDDWYMQLSYLCDKNANIVLIDEFSRSFSTARELIRLLEHQVFGLSHKAYIPVLDFAPESVRRPPFTYPLYRLPYLGTSDIRA